MKKTTLALVLAAFGAATFAPAHAADDGRRAAAREKWEQMTPEEKAAAKEKARAKWESMSPEEREAAKKRFAERHPRAAQRLADKASSPAR